MNTKKCRKKMALSVCSSHRSVFGHRAKSLAGLLVFVTTVIVAHPSTTASASKLWGGVPQAIIVRTTENVTTGGWVWILNKAQELGISRIDILVKQDENNFTSERTHRNLVSGEFLVDLPGESTAEGWENSDWLVEMLARGKQLGIEIWAWWPTFQDAQLARMYPDDAYPSADGSVFLDPAVEGVRRRQEELLRKLAKNYAFDGISLDWLRYDKLEDGRRGPSAERFLALTGKPWSARLMHEPLARAVWNDLRAAAIGDWVERLVARSRRSHPRLKWGAFVLPWQFEEVAQSYRRLGNAGLNYLQPMIYWEDWDKGPHWTRDVLRGRTFWEQNTTSLWPVFDLATKEEELLLGLAELPVDDIAGLSWFVYGTWTDGDFAKLERIRNSWVQAG